MERKKRNIITTLISQLVATACGVVIPRVLISTFGSAMYGLVTSIAQFLSYISLLEGGIGRVARAELYTPLAQKDLPEISRVYNAIKHYFATVGAIFIAYTLAMSLVYYDMVEVREAGRMYTFFLIWIISAGTLAKYMGGLSNLTLLNADQRQYVGNLIVTAATIGNAVLVVLLSKAGCSLLVVKIGSGLMYIAQPVGYWLYVRKRYKLPNVGKQRAKLKQQWTGMGQHIAYFLHTNTDVVILTLFSELRLVAVYSVYRLVISSVRKIAASFTSGMEAAFGEMIARQEQTDLQKSFRGYKHLLSSMSVLLFGATAVLIVPFVRLYTKGVTDADYIQPLFAMVLLFAEAIDCFMHPCCSLPVSANKLKETRWGSYGEASINIVLSLILVHWNPLIGIALATLLATVFKAVYYMAYAARHILRLKFVELLKNFLLTNSLLAVFAAAGMILARYAAENYFQWALWGVAAVAGIGLVTFGMFFLFYPQEQKAAVRHLCSRLKKLQ